MKRCLLLAQQSKGMTSPNPMVGAVIVARGRIIGEGYHQRYGEAHAEVNAIASVAPCNFSLLKESTLFVNLEPCSHYGKTPPCVDLILSKKIPHVVIGCLDPFGTAGRGVKYLQEAGVKVEVGICQEQCEELNKRFLTFYKRQRPYIWLKWAQSEDGFMGKIGERIHFSTPETLLLVHEMRQSEDAILIGTTTALEDNPRLTCCCNEACNPIRMVIDRELRIPLTHHLFDGTAQTVVFTECKMPSKEKITYVQLNFTVDILSQIMVYCYEKKIESLIVEGGSELLKSFIDKRLYDEIRVEVSPLRLGEGVKAPNLDFRQMRCEHVGKNKIFCGRSL